MMVESLMISFNMKLQSLFKKKLLDLLNGCVLFLAPEFINIPPLNLVPTPKYQSNLACVINTHATKSSSRVTEIRLSLIPRLHF